MKFENPAILYLLFLIPFIIVFLVYTFKHKMRLLERFCKMAVCSKIIDGFDKNRLIIKKVLITIVLMLLILSLARPQIGFIWKDIQRKGVDIYVAIDVSDSMLAEDIKPNRLERAKRELMDLINLLQGDRIGLVVFAGESFVQCPLTLDYNAIQMFIDSISHDSVSQKGTSITSAIKTCLDAFKRGAESNSKAIILITDGEDHSGQALQMAEQAKKENVIIYAIGLGDEAGSYIPIPGGLKKDRSGKSILSKPNFGELKEIAKITGGVYSSSVTGNLDIESVYLQGIKKTLKDKKLKTTREQEWVERFQWPLFFAFLLLIIEFFYSDRKSETTLSRFALNKTKVIWLIAIITTMIIFAASARAESFNDQMTQGQDAYKRANYQGALDHFLNAQVEKPQDSKLNYNIGNTYYKMANYTKALGYYKESLKPDTSDLQKSKQFYNIANTLYKLGENKETLKYYLKALYENPDDIEAKQNYEFVLNKEKNPPKQCENPNNKDNKKDKDKNKNQDKKDEQKDNDKQDQKQDKQNNDQQKQNDDKNNDKQQQKQPKKQSSDKLDKKQAESILSNIEEGKKPAKKDSTGFRFYTDKDW